MVSLFSVTLCIGGGDPASYANLTSEINVEDPEEFRRFH